MERKELIDKLKWCLNYFNDMGLSEPNITIQEAIQALESKEPKPSDAVEFAEKERFCHIHKDEKIITQRICPKCEAFM